MRMSTQLPELFAIANFDAQHGTFENRPVPRKPLVVEWT